MLDRKRFGGNIALNFDVKKAFDTIDWKFLIHVLQSFGFDSKFCNWVEAILVSANLSLSINGHSVGFFKYKWGVRQGDPLSPLLFCLAEEVLSGGISALVDSGKLVPMSSSRGFQTPSHVMYVDDILVLYKGTKSNLRNLMNLFHWYGECSGQLLSIEKCKKFSKRSFL